MRQELARAYLIKGALTNAQEQLTLLSQKFPRNSYAFLGLGFLSLAKGFDNFAVEYFLKAQKNDPGDPRATLGLAGLYGFRGDFEKARQEYQSRLDRMPLDRGARLGLGQIYAHQGLFQKATAEFEQALVSFPQDTSCRLALAMTLLESDEMERAEKEIKRVLRQNPDDLSGRLLLGDLLQRTARAEEARQTYEKIYTQDRRYLWVGLRLAFWHGRRGAWGQAQALLDQIAQNLPTPETAMPLTFASFEELQDVLEIKENIRQLHLTFALTQAEVHLLKTLYVDAERNVQEALSRSPLNLQALRLMVRIKRIRALPLESARWAQKAANAYPQHPLLLLDRAELAMTLHHPEEALTFAKGAVTACPTLAAGPAMLARIYLIQAELDEAHLAAKKAISLNPLDPEALFSWGLVERAQGHPEATREVFLRSLQLDPFQARIHQALGRLALAQKQARQAREHFQRAAELEPFLYSSPQ